MAAMGIQIMLFGSRVSADGDDGEVLMLTGPSIQAKWKQAPFAENAVRKHSYDVH